MNVFAFASFVLMCVATASMAVLSLLVFCGSRLVITEKMRQDFHVKPYKLHVGLYYLSLAILSASMAYILFNEAGLSGILIFAYMVWGFVGSIYFQKSRRYKKNPEATTEPPQITDSQAKSTGLLMIGMYMALPVLVLVYAFIRYL